MRQVMSPSNGIPLYLRDQVGIFHGIAPGEVPENKVSDMKMVIIILVGILLSIRFILMKMLEDVKLTIQKSD